MICVNTINVENYSSVAFFDVDRTLVRGVSTEFIFLTYLIKRGKFKFIDLLRSLFFILKYAPRFKKGIFDLKKNKAYLKNKSVNEMRELGERCFEEEILQYLPSKAKELIDFHKKRGDIVVLLSGSLDFLVEPLKRHLGAHEVIATEIAKKDGIYLGRLKGIYPYGTNKLKLAEEFCRERGLDLKGGYAYADHYSDRSILEGVGHPVAVNPDVSLKRLAKERGWMIADL